MERNTKPSKKPKKRYFEQETDFETKPEQLPAEKKDAEAEVKFDGEVIQVKNHAKPYRQKWNKDGPKKFRKQPIDPYKLERHSRGPGIDKERPGVQTNFHKRKLKRKEIYYQFANEQAARMEILLNEDTGYIDAENGESTAEYLQSEIVRNVDITAATKHFNLTLEFGPYRMRYTRNGRHLLIGGRKGHVAAFDWITKRLHCEMNVMEEVFDVAWLHIETMFAVAQKNYVNFYDNQGTELHCVKAMHRVTRMEFLPYHFLLATGSDKGFMMWLDVSIGEIVAKYDSRTGPIQLMCQNPMIGILCTGSAKGVVSMWTPSNREPVAKMLCHSTPLSAIAVDPKGLMMATAGLDTLVKIWDIRQLTGPTFQYKLRTAAHELDLSQKGLLAMGMGNVCEIYKKPNLISGNEPYLRHRCPDYIQKMEFCPYEDVLGVSTISGFTSLLVPGSGEPNFDGYEANPYQTKSQRREHEIKSLLDKIPMELISLDSSLIGQVDVPTFKEKVEAKQKIMLMKPPKINFEPRKKMKGKGGSANAAKSRQIVKDTAVRQFKKDMKDVQSQLFAEHKSKDDNVPKQRDGPVSVLDRFKEKKKVKKK